MKRKVAQIGPSTLMISLPSKWAKKFGVKKGNEIDIEEKKDSLLIRTVSSAPEFTSVTVDISGPSKIVRRYLGNLYRKGYDEMKLQFKDPSYMKEIQKYVPNFLGLEIIQQGDGFCIVRNVANVKDEEFDNIFNRMFLLTISMGEDVVEGIKENKLDVLSNVSILEITHNKLFNFCLRVINKPGFQKNVYLMGHLLLRLEDIGDWYRDIAEYLVKNKKLKVSEHVLSLLEETVKHLRKDYELYSKFDSEKAIHIQEGKKRLIEEAAALLEKVPKEEIYIVHLIMNLINDFSSAASPIMALYL